KNAALLATSIMALQNPELAARLEAWRAVQTASVADTPVTENE
ncbi:5-(carboxyamino)imidazole ribonucleotide mutase, partial [Acetobacter okinawensis]|nr:5-(carboxyamino)imidazole ribonucleotide mutase [Acetobacter okinawensis]